MNYPNNCLFCNTPLVIHQLPGHQPSGACLNCAQIHSLYRVSFYKHFVSFVVLKRDTKYIYWFNTVDNLLWCNSVLVSNEAEIPTKYVRDIEYFQPNPATFYKKISIYSVLQ